ncbi:hypothetical protein [Pantanalinema sp. GBBB05]|uniref:hypothetical protein n=1 Tax=Pantanalinema sp. GBBB05 TaxID=2604139 RepID=UPI001E023E98|nr:hypothetical protein [Pantanalinema sp. GBBB05]
MRRRSYLVIFGGAMLAVGAVFIWAGIPHTTSVICQRSSGTQIECQKQEKILWWIPIKTISFERLHSVRLGKGENAYDGTVYFILLSGKTGEFIFGNTLDETEIQGDLLTAQEFYRNREIKLLRLERYEADWLAVALGLPIAALGVWIMIYRQV